MYTATILAAVAALTSALPSPQLIDLPAIAEYPGPVLVKAPIDNVADALTGVPSSSKRDLTVEKRDGDCLPYPAGSGPVPSPDTVEAFVSFPTFAVRPTPSTRKEQD